jgi:hypothetical protein
VPILSDSHPELTTSSRDVEETLVNERRRHQINTTGKSRSVTMSVSARRQFVAGQAVFWKDPDGMEWAGTIVRHIRTDCSNEFEIQLHRNMVDREEVETRTVDCSVISPDFSAELQKAAFSLTNVVSSRSVASRLFRYIV